jgi:hypothetical protein
MAIVFMEPAERRLMRETSPWSWGKPGLYAMLRVRSSSADATVSRWLA